MTVLRIVSILLTRSSEYIVVFIAVSMSDCLSNMRQDAYGQRLISKLVYIHPI